MTYKYKLLSIDGGGIRGIIPAVILAEIEKRTGKRIFELFNLISGTSTGGIVALGLTKPNPTKPGEAHYTAHDLLDLYKNQGARIFDEKDTKLNKTLEQAYKESQKLLPRFPAPLRLPKIDLNSLHGSKFSATGREEVLTQFLGETPIKDALKEVFITSYDTELRTPIFFTSNDKEEKTSSNNFQKICNGFTMKQAAMATSAAPTYFEAYKVPSIIPKSGYYSLIDGGVFANNPTSLAIMEAIISHKKSFKETLTLNDILVVSLGTGSLIKEYYYEDIKRWGLLSWVQPLFNIVMDGQSESVTCQLEQLLPEAEDEPKQYYRFQGRLENANDNIDDTSQANISGLEQLAQLIIQQRDTDLDKLCEQLVE